jgi:O-antigen/teichoic acid export membrane protein
MEVLEVGKSYVKGVTYIFAGRIIFFILNVISFIIIARMLANIYGSSEPLGWLLVLLFIPQLTMLLGDLGIGYGAANKCAKLFKERNFKELASYAWSSIYFSLILHVIYSALTFFLGQFLVINLYSKPEILPYVHFLAMYILLNFFFGIGQGTAIILDKTWVFSLMLILYALVQATLAPLALYLGFQFLGLIFVYFILMPLISSIPGLIILFKYIKPTRMDFNKVKEMLRFGFPIAASAFILIPSARIYEILISRYASSVDLGNFSIAQRFNFILDVFLYPIGSLMFVNYSKLNKTEDLNIALNFTIKIISYFVAPISFFTIFFSKELIVAFFGPYYIDGWPYLSLIGAYWLLYCAGGVAIANLVMSQGYTKKVFKYSVIYAISATISSVVLIPLFSIYGALIGALIAGWPSYIPYLRFVKKQLNLEIKFYEVIKILIIALISVIPSYIIWLTLSRIIVGVAQFYILLFSCILISFAIYIFSTKRLKILKDSEISFLENSLKEIPYAGNLISFVFGIYKKL